MNYPELYPKTIESAAEFLIDTLHKENITAIKKMKEGDLWSLHMNLGQGIRNSMGLWGIIKSC